MRHHRFSQSRCRCAVMLGNTSDVLLRLLLMKHSDVAHILNIHMKHSNSVSAALSSEHTHLHTDTHRSMHSFKPQLVDPAHGASEGPDCKVSKELQSPGISEVSHWTLQL